MWCASEVESSVSSLTREKCSFCKAKASNTAPVGRYTQFHLPKQVLECHCVISAYIIVFQTFTPIFFELASLNNYLLFFLFVRFALNQCPKPRPREARGVAGVPQGEPAEPRGFHGCAPLVRILSLRPYRVFITDLSYGHSLFFIKIFNVTSLMAKITQRHLWQNIP